MSPKRRMALDEIIMKFRKGRVSRRTFLERVLAVGLTSAAALTLLESCGESRSATYLVWQSEFDNSGVYQDLVKRFNSLQKDVHVVLQIGAPATDDLVTMERNMFLAKSVSVDIFSVDIIYVSEFASHGWLEPISEKQWPISERKKYLSQPIDACTFNKQLWAAPFRADVGLIYYRTDLVSQPPKTWEELTETAKSIINSQSNPSRINGYVWEGAQYEGLVCNFDEVLHGYGGSLFQRVDDPKEVTVNSPEAIQALETMVNWIYTSHISPEDTLTYTEEIARQAWEDGSAIFMRNWPYVYSATKQNPRLQSKFAIHPMLSGGNNTAGHSSIGGWNLAMNARIDSDRKAAAWQFIQYMLGLEAQRVAAIKASWTVTLQSIYKDTEVLKQVPLLNQLLPMLQTAVPRPITPKYMDISTAIRFRVRQALSRTLPPREALAALEIDLKKIVA